MHFNLIETLGLAGDPAHANDDRAGHGNATAWIIDGATDLGEPGLLGPRGGAAWLAGTANAAFAAAGDRPLEPLCRHVFAALHHAYETERTRAPLSRWELPMAAFLALAIADGMVELAWAGDCVALLGAADGIRRFGAALNGRDAEAAHAASLTHHGLGGAVKARAAPVLGSLRKSRERADRHLLGVEPDAADHLQRATCRCAPGDSLLLMTDGFAALVEPYGLFDDAALLAALEREGLTALAGRLRALENADAECHRHPRFKKSDDATALWLRIAA